MSGGQGRGGKAAPARPGSHLPGRRQSRPSRSGPRTEFGLPSRGSSANAPPPKSELRTWPLSLHPPPPRSGRPLLGPGPGVCSSGQCPGLRPGRGLGLRGPVRGPAASATVLGLQCPDRGAPPGSQGGGVGTRGAERTDLEVQRHLPGRRRRPAAPSAGGEGTEAGAAETPAARGVPAPLACSHDRRLCRAAPAFEALDWAGPDRAGRGDGYSAGGGPEGAGPGEPRNLNCPLYGGFNRCCNLRCVMTSEHNLTVSRDPWLLRLKSPSPQLFLSPNTH